MLRAASAAADAVVRASSADDLGPFHGVPLPIKDLYDAGRVAIMHGVGYPVPHRSHFRCMDIWHTAEPTTVGDQS